MLIHVNTCKSSSKKAKKMCRWTLRHTCMPRAQTTPLKVIKY